MRPRASSAFRKFSFIFSPSVFSYSAPDSLRAFARSSAPMGTIDNSLILQLVTTLSGPWNSRPAMTRLSPLGMRTALCCRHPTLKSVTWPSSTLVSASSAAATLENTTVAITASPSTRRLRALPKVDCTL